MKDQEKTKDQLIAELVALRQEVGVLKALQIQNQQTEKALRESNDRFRLLVENVQDYAIFTLDSNGYIDSWNIGAENILGYQEAEIIGGCASCIFTPEDREQGEDNQELQKAVEEGKAVDERWHLRKDGTRFWACGILTALRDETGSLRGFAKIMRDMTDRKRAEQQIQQQAALLDVTTDAILVQDLSDRILFWNKGAECLYGLPAESVLGLNVNELLYGATPPPLRNIHQSIVEKGSWQGELHQVCHNGQKIIVSSRWTLISNFEGHSQSILVVNTDITEKKQLETRFLQAQRLESLGTLASGMAHDLNNVLAPILMAVQLLIMKLSDEQSQRLLQRVENNAKRGAALVRQVLSFARGLEGEHTILEVKSLILEIEQLVKQTFPKNITVYTSIAEDICPVSGNATQLYQVLMNLVVNARDAMPNGGVLSICAENLLLDEEFARRHIEACVGSYVMLCVSDTGTGMPPEVLERIFEPFFTTKEVGQGTGLGLSTVMGIIKSHGGFVDVESSVGQGTQFKVYLKAVEETQTQPTQDVKLPSGQGEWILVVDDETAILEVTQTALELYNYKVLTTCDGNRAIALYAEHQDKISVVLVDMTMPCMDGSTIIRTLQAMNSQVKIIAISGLSSNRHLAQTISTNVKAFLSKPFTTDKLLNTIHSVLGMNQ
ncbi:PAS domain S-box protein [Chlorogloeopsis sp. ULAP01]|uniref:PAS domain-containing hybrid sensor histidine kinase/response regulator n=1 Tax=Chlorogloeopsis sp. ULAP01 TaxID=3056483 RepID=UPI0025AA9B8B|nr:PAS domain-containing sensor histidine kinase [Chlorogloeopsis sp. ULAP01]MDM9383408.1 PAS domain S-box protein [Chlorogloeopsis sp. ULAP01]